MPAAPQIIGHRGARALYAENTLAGFAAAASLGFDHFEIDVAITADGVCVLSHDPCLTPDLTRMADGSWLQRTDYRISRLTLAQLQDFNVGALKPGSRSARRFSRQAGVPFAAIPTLEAALRLNPAWHWTVEVKCFFNRPWLTPPPEVMTQAVLEVIDRTGAAGRCVIQSFDWRVPRLVAQRRPSLARAWLTTRSTRAWHGGHARLPQSIVDEGGGTWAPRYLELTRRLVEHARGMGLRVVPWTVNSPDAVARLAGWGVDGIITDDPLVARAAIGP